MHTQDSVENDKLLKAFTQCTQYILPEILKIFSLFPVLEEPVTPNNSSPVVPTVARSPTPTLDSLTSLNPPPRESSCSP